MTDQFETIPLSHAAPGLTLDEHEAVRLMSALGVSTIADLDLMDADPKLQWERGYLSPDQVASFYSAMRRIMTALTGGSSPLFSALLRDSLGDFEASSAKAVAQLRDAEDFAQAKAAEVMGRDRCECGKYHGTFLITLEDVVDDRSEEAWRRQSIEWICAHGIERDIAETMLASSRQKADYIADGGSTDGVVPDTPGRRALTIRAVRSREDFRILADVRRNLRRIKVEEGLRVLGVLFPGAGQDGAA